MPALKATCLAIAADLGPPVAFVATVGEALREWWLEDHRIDGNIGRRKGEIRAMGTRVSAMAVNLLSSHEGVGSSIGDLPHLESDVPTAE